MKRYLFALLFSTRVLDFVAWMNRRKVTILSYHSVIDGGQPVRPDPHKQHIPLYLFQKHLDYLQSNCTVVSLAEFLRARQENRRLPNYSVVLTFEDGFRDFYTVAAAPLRQRCLAATVFVITDRAASGSLPVNGEYFLSWQEIRELALSGIEIGSHTCSHPKLTELPVDDVRRELADSRAAILDHVDQVDVPFSYPHGRTSHSISRLSQSLGYSCAIASMLGPNDREADTFGLGRTTIASDDDLATFAARVSGLTWWINRLRSFFGAENANEWDPDSSRSYGSLTPKPYGVEPTS
jgi:peptidoglycan/xylan/chitin deacetylase (PgdA/CDA1 family)